MEQQLASLGLAGTRIDARTPASLSEGEVRDCDARGLSTAVRCCSLSHLEAMRRFLAGNASYALILEDDAILSKALPGFLADFGSAPRDGIWRIETAMKGVRSRGMAGSLGGFAFFRPRNFEGGSGGYILSRSAATIILEHVNLRIAIDEALFDPFGTIARRVPLVQVTPALTVQSHLRRAEGQPRFKSDLNKARAHPKGLTKVRHAVAFFLRRDIVYGSQRTLQQFLGAKKAIIPFAD